MTLATRTLATGHRVLLVLNKRRCMHPRAKARGRRSNRPGNSQARGPRPEGHSDPCCHHHSSGPRFTLSISPLAQKMVPFAGFEMPVQYPSGILNEHLHTRSKAGLFYVWHMGPAAARRSGPGQRAQCLRTGRRTPKLFSAEWRMAFLEPPCYRL